MKRLKKGFLVTPKKAGRVNLTPPLSGFPKNVSSKERVKPWFPVTFNIVISHILPEIFIEIPQVVQNEDFFCQY